VWGRKNPLQAIASGKGMRPLLLAEPAQHFEEWFDWTKLWTILKLFPFCLAGCSIN